MLLHRYKTGPYVVKIGFIQIVSDS